MASQAELAKDGRSLTVRVPITLRRRGGRKQVVTPSGQPGWSPQRYKVDSTLVKAVARAHRWQRMLDDRVYASVSELAHAERINPSYVARVLRLTLLAPEIVESVLDGTSGAIGLADLLKGVPVHWAKPQGCLSFHHWLPSPIRERARVLRNGVLRAARSSKPKHIGN